MKITIIPIDGAVYKDGVSFNKLDLSSAPADVHALQFNTASSAGWIEFKDDDFGNKPNNQPITALPSWANDCLNKWDEAKAAYDAAVEAAKQAAKDQPATQGTQTL
jgi:hypothetical protein